jgi:hypothetical protein
MHRREFFQKLATATVLAPVAPKLIAEASESFFSEVHINEVGWWPDIELSDSVFIDTPFLEYVRNREHSALRRWLASPQDHARLKDQAIAEGFSFDADVHV